MNLTKTILVPVLSLIFLSHPILDNYCFATELSSGMEESFCPSEENQIEHHQTDCHNKSPCQYDHFCCTAATLSTISFLSGLDSYPLNSVEIFFQPLEVTQFLYHPPRILS